MGVILRAAVLINRYLCVNFKRNINLISVAMSEIFNKILKLIKTKDLVVSNHGYDELSEDNIWLKDLLASAKFGVVVEDYPDYPKGPCVLILQQDSNGAPIHVVWGIPKGRQSPAVLITAYRPDRSIWSEDFTRRKT